MTERVQVGDRGMFHSVGKEYSRMGITGRSNNVTYRNSVMLRRETHAKYREYMNELLQR